MNRTTDNGGKMITTEQARRQMQERITRHAARLQLPEHVVAGWFLEGAQRQMREASERLVGADVNLSAALAVNA